MNITTPTILIMGLLSSVSLTASERVEESKNWSERFELTTGSPVLELHNIWGDVTILPGPEGEMTLTISENRSAPSQALFDRSLQVYGLNVRSDDSGVEVQVGERRQSWRGEDPCRRCRVDYQFEARVPPNTRVFASTVNDGRVEISGITGAISADNVNGPVAVLDARSCERVESINGNVSLSFASAPASDCHIETINGDINIEVPDGSGLDVAVDLGNGRIRSEIPLDPVAIPARVQHRESGATHKYTIEQAAGLRLAGGGPRFSVTSMNGDLRIEKSK